MASEGSLSPSNYLENLLKMYECSISKEYRLINEVKYPISRFNYVSVGLSTVRGFLPVIKIASAKKCVTLTKDEWYKFLMYQERITNYMNISESRKRKIVEKETIIDNFDIDVVDNINLKLQRFIQLSGQLISVVKILRCDSEILLHKTSVQNLFNKSLINLLTRKLERFEKLDFVHDYNTVLRSVVQHKEKAEKVDEYVRRLFDDPLDYNPEAKHFFHLRDTETADCILEITVYELNKIKRDVDSFSILEMK